LEKPMSMDAVFIQVAPAEFARVEANLGLGEPLFTPNFASPMAKFGDLSKQKQPN